MFANILADPVQMGFLVLIMGSAVLYGARFIMAEISAYRSLFKTLPVAAMIGLSLWLGGPVSLSLALALCALGDYFLSLDERKFIAGLSAFLAGHLAYIWLFFSLIIIHFDRLSLIHLAVVGLYSLVFALYLWRKAGKHRVPVMVYIGVITIMAMQSLLMPSELCLITVGALVFVISDTVLALRMFVLNAGDSRKKILSVIVWWTYIAGQLAILIGVASA